METLLNFTLFGSVIAFYISLIILFFLFIFSEREESLKVAIGAFLIFSMLNYFWGNLPLLEILTVKNIGIYISIGFIFAIIRTYFKGRELNEKDRKRFNLKEAIFRWWFLFPISSINWIFSKILKDFYNFIYSKFQKFFEFVFNPE